MTVLGPLAARYAQWLRLPAAATADTAAEDPALVRAMAVVLRVERNEPPGRTPLLEAAAAAAVAVCLDPRAAEPTHVDDPVPDESPDAEGAEDEPPVETWHDELVAWVGGRIRKVSRRARGAHWAAVQELPGVTVTVGGASVRALVPGLVAQAPKEVSRLQISGSDLPADEPGPPPDGVPVLWLNPDVEMTVGKAAAQVGHATMILAALCEASGVDLTAWAENGYRCAVRTPDRDRWAALHPGTDPAAAWRSRGVVAVRDAGFTEVAPGTVTVLAQWA
jgi:peptidyl-tRNA hydrolase